jgi:streptogramin lyase
VPETGIGSPATQDGNVWIIQQVFPAGQLIAQELTPCLLGVPGSGVTLPTGGSGLISGPDGNLWLILHYPDGTEQIGRGTTDGVLTTYSLPSGTAPNQLAGGPDGNIWFTDYASDKVARMTTGGSVTSFDLPTSNAGPGAITAGPDGNLWFTEVTANQIGRITTTGSVTEYPIPTAESQLYAIAPGADGAMWFTERIGKLGRITIAGAVSEIRVPYANASPTSIVGKSDGTIWFTDSRPQPYGYGIDRIGRLSPATGCAPNSQTLCLNVGAFSVTVSFQDSPEGISSPANAVALTGNTGYFWFFDPANIEMTVKVLDGCSLNAHYWVFAAGMTNVGVDWKVTNNLSGTTNNYSNAVGTPFQPVQDTEAFPCS